MEDSLITSRDELDLAAHRPGKRALDAVLALFKRLLLLIFFGPGVIGTAWVVGKIFRKR